MPSAPWLDNLQADNATDPILYLMTIDHADLPEPIRWVRDKAGVTSNGQAFIAFPFEFAPPGETEDGRTPARIVIDNVDMRIVHTMRALTSPPVLHIQSVLRSDPDTVEEDYPVFEVTSVSGDRFQLQADMLDENDDNEAVMQWTFTPGTAPALVK
jgi:hypothetical protein